jgi:hypothetical protein
MLVGDGKRNRSGPDPDVEDARFGNGPQEVEAALDDDFGLRPRNQGPLVDLEIEPAKAPLAEYVGKGLSRHPPLDELAQPPCLEVRHISPG